ncbi:MAG: hypothetical protein M1365_12525 [Actinobacteria bacterium]|nr:hypothetical protein [Actinomycetota bacterium]
MARTKVLTKEKEFTEEKELIVSSVTGEITGEILPADKVPESLLVPAEKQEDKGIPTEQLQFIGTDGWGIISIKHGDSYGSPEKYYNVKYKLEDKFFHILEKGKEKEEGLFIPMSKVKYFRFDLAGELLPCKTTECIRSNNDCDRCELNLENIKKLEICGLKECKQNFGCSWCKLNPNKDDDDDDEDDESMDDIRKKGDKIMKSLESENEEEPEDEDVPF